LPVADQVAMAIHSPGINVMQVIWPDLLAVINLQSRMNTTTELSGPLAFLWSRCYPAKPARIIVACCVLRNIAISRKEQSISTTTATEYISQYSCHANECRNDFFLPMEHPGDVKAIPDGINGGTETAAVKSWFAADDNLIEMESTGALEERGILELLAICRLFAAVRDVLSHIYGPKACVKETMKFALIDRFNKLRAKCGKRWIALGCEEIYD
uniref:NR LBD domain-containing protein n=1 Tax=Haemonchus placei TaxID=6290 RepID=A0A158QMR9_HAEPC